MRDKPAFPTPFKESFDGMTLRDYFAAAALTGLLVTDTKDPWPERRTAAKAAYEFADAMLEMRKNPNE